MAVKKKKLKALAVKLTELSRGPSGDVEEVRVRDVLSELTRTFAPQTLRAVLKFYYASIARELRFSEARIECAGTLPEGATKALAAHFSKLYARSISPVAEVNPGVLGGLRVQVGDDVYDASLAGTLARLRLTLTT